VGALVRVRVEDGHIHAFDGERCAKADDGERPAHSVFAAGDRDDRIGDDSALV
jgi:hypothetical protein